jgi:hypothetical protein
MSASYLDLHLDIDNDGRVRTKLYDNRDDLNVPIVNFPYICSNIPAALAYGVYISQLMGHSRVCGSYYDFLDGGFLLVKLKSSLLKRYHRPQYLVDSYEIYVSQMATDMFHVSSAHPGAFLIRDLSHGLQLN